MATDNRVKFDTMSEADLGPVLKLLQGGNSKRIAQEAGITETHLLQMRDDLLSQANREQARATTGTPPKKIGRNDPCPCGSGKKYKHCCLGHEPAAGQTQDKAEAENQQVKAKEQNQLIQQIEDAFGLLSAGRHDQALDRASKLLERYPNEDRLHDIVATGYLYTKRFEAAIKICKHRLAIAESEKSFFIEHGRYRDADLDQPALSYYYPPLTWLQKYWIAIKAKDYQDLYPIKENAEIIGLVNALQTADDITRFPQKHGKGLELRRTGLKDTLEQLKAMGPEVIPYLLPLSSKYSWAGLFVPEILAACPVDQAIRPLIDISMFGFAYSSGASLHYLEKRGAPVIPYIQEAFTIDREFDPIKTGILSVLGNIQTPEAYQLLLGLLEHDSPHIVNWAGDALGRFNNIAVLPAMMAANDRIGGEKMIERAIRRLKDLENTA